MIINEIYLKLISYISLTVLLTILLTPIIDELSFFILNGHLLFTNNIYQFIFAALNHPFENYANLIFFLISLSYGALISNYDKKKSFFFICGAIIFFEFFFHLFVLLDQSKLLLRASPSCFFTYLNLQDVFPSFPVKVTVFSSFPSGHSMAAAYWASLAQKIYDLKYKNIIYLISIFMCIPRLVSGAHWLSDVWVGFIIGKELFNLYEVMSIFLSRIFNRILDDFCFFYKKNIKCLIKN